MTRVLAARGLGAQCEQVLTSIGSDRLVGAGRAQENELVVRAVPI